MSLLDQVAKSPQEAMKQWGMSKVGPLPISYKTCARLSSLLGQRRRLLFLGVAFHFENPTSTALRLKSFALGRSDGRLQRS
jgi:hypothetical protein